MKRYKDTGLIFKHHNINESDRILSILTRFHGRVDAIAKGVRRITSHKAGSLDIADLSKFYFATGRNLDIITEVKLINDYSSLKKKLESTFLIFYICELIDKFTLTGEKEKELFDLTIELLNELSKDINSLLIRSYEIKILSLKGYEPNLHSCLNCDKRFSPKIKLYLSKISPGFICNCQKGNITKKDYISQKSIKTLKYFLKNPLFKARKIIKDQLLENELQSITTVWIESILEQKIKSERFL